MKIKINWQIITLFSVSIHSNPSYRGHSTDTKDRLHGTQHEFPEDISTAAGDLGNTK